MGFFEGLTDNIRAASESALIKSVVGGDDERRYGEFSASRG
jgi:hypothetical protein